MLTYSEWVKPRPLTGFSLKEESGQENPARRTHEAGNAESRCAFLIRHIHLPFLH